MEYLTGTTVLRTVYSIDLTTEYTFFPIPRTNFIILKTLKALVDNQLVMGDLIPEDEGVSIQDLVNKNSPGAALTPGGFQE